MRAVWCESAKILFLEVLVDAAQLTALKHELSKEINEDVDSIRFYRLGNSYQNRIDSMGKKAES